MAAPQLPPPLPISSLRYSVLPPRKGLPEPEPRGAGRPFAPHALRPSRLPHHPPDPGLCPGARLRALASHPGTAHSGHIKHKVESAWPHVPCLRASFWLWEDLTLGGAGAEAAFPSCLETSVPRSRVLLLPLSSSRWTSGVWPLRPASPGRSLSVPAGPERYVLFLAPPTHTHTQT